ncbi:integral membrane protein [Mycobacterium tuberculosis]|nr:integral membrane protein [Mycobacterium tuberculosis]
MSIDKNAAGTVYERFQGTEEFQELRRRFRRFAFPMTAAFLSWYLLYVVLSGWARDFMGHELFGSINIALVFGMLQFVSTFGIAYLYSRHAERRFDPMADKIRGEIEAEGAQVAEPAEDAR